MIIPEDVLQKQFCSQCYKYLSVSPIKVYPNRQVKCGRCPQDDDLGVESPIYQTVVKYMMFPCVNRYDGCNAVLPMCKINCHESECNAEVYDCFLCSEFKGTAYDLNLHCQKYHQKETLQNSEFLIDLSKIYHNEVFFHSKGVHLFFVHCNYDMDLGKLTLDVIFIGKLYKGNMSYSLRLYSIKKDLLYKTKQLPCSIMELRLGKRAVVNLATMKFPRKLAVCQFIIHEEPEFTCVENIPIIDSAFDSFILKCNFKNVHENNFEDPVCFPAVYYFKGIEWNVFFKRKLSLTDYKRKFGVFLRWDNSSNDYAVESCKVSATFSIISSDCKMKLSRSFIKREYKKEYQCHGLMLADWNFIMDATSGFIEENCLNVEIKMRIYLHDKRDVKCIGCNKNCVYCI